MGFKAPPNPNNSGICVQGIQGLPGPAVPHCTMDGCDGPFHGVSCVFSEEFGFCFVLRAPVWIPSSSPGEQQPFLSRGRGIAWLTSGLHSCGAAVPSLPAAGFDPAGSWGSVAGLLPQPLQGNLTVKWGILKWKPRRAHGTLRQHFPSKSLSACAQHLL